MYEMKKEYYIGIEHVDEQHKRLFEIANEAYNLLKNEFIPDKYDHVVRLIQELADYAEVHFADEEAYMEQMKYKRILSQKVEHAEFMEKIRSIDLSDLDENQEGVILDLLTFLNDWLVHHILEKDKLIAE